MNKKYLYYIAMHWLTEVAVKLPYILRTLPITRWIERFSYLEGCVRYVPMSLNHIFHPLRDCLCSDRAIDILAQPKILYVRITSIGIRT